MTKRIIGVFKDKRIAAEAFEQLVREGFPREAISVLLSDTAEGRAFLAGEKSSVAEGALTGTAVGTVIAALGAGALALPGIGVIAAGPIAAALGGAGVGAASGGLLGALVGLGIPENEATLRDEEVRSGGILVGVETSEETIATAEELLKSTGAASVVRT